MRKSVQQRMFKSISRWQRSGLSRKAWCEKNDIAYGRFHYWYNRYRMEEQAEPSGQQDDRLVPLLIESSPVTGTWCEVSLPEGKKLAFYYPVSAEFLKGLID